MFIAIILLIGSCIILQRCTRMNLSPKLLWNHAKYKQFPELQNGLQWGDFTLYRITESSSGEITYYPEKNFFLIFNSSKAGHFNQIKIDNRGNKTFELDFPENHPFGLLGAINSYVIGIDSIYDLSADYPVAASFSEVLNKKTDFSNKDWVETFGRLYSASDIVIYSHISDLPNAGAAYFRMQGKWTKLYSSDKDNFIYAGTGTKITCKINGKEIPPKYDDEPHYLKDVQNATYSNALHYTDDYITPFNGDSSFFPDQAFTYPQAGVIKTLAFEKIHGESDGYNPLNIPVRFYGMGYYALEIDNHILDFKTIGCKEIFGGKLNTDLYVFGLPEQYIAENDVRFLMYAYSTNSHDNNKKGIYIIKKK